MARPFTNSDFTLDCAKRKKFYTLFALTAWRRETLYARPDDLVFASDKLKGAKPRTDSMVSEKSLRPAAVKAGVLGANERIRFGFHNLRHALASFLVSQGTDSKTVQSLLRHSNVSKTLGIYTHAVAQNKLKAQVEYLAELLKPDKSPLERKRTVVLSITHNWGGGADRFCNLLLTFFVIPAKILIGSSIARRTYYPCFHLLGFIHALFIKVSVSAAKLQYFTPVQFRKLRGREKTCANKKGSP